MEGAVRYHFTPQEDYKLASFNTTERKETLKQWFFRYLAFEITKCRNLDECLCIRKFSVVGNTQLQHAPEILSDFFANPDILADLNVRLISSAKNADVLILNR